MDPSRLRSALAPVALLGTGLAISASLIATSPSAESGPPTEERPSVPVVQARFGPRTLDLRAHGTVAPQHEIRLASEVAGRIAWLSDAFTPGGHFREGEVLLRLERTDHADRVREARAEVTLARAEAEEAEAALARQQALADEKIASAARLDAAAARHEVAMARHARAEAALARRRRDLARTEISVPFAGRVRAAEVDVGQFVARGTELGVVFSAERAEVRLPVSADALERLAIPIQAVSGAVLPDGPPVLLSAEVGQTTHQWRGRIARVEAALDDRNRSVVLVAVVDEPEGAGSAASGMPLLVGLFVDATVEGRTLPRAFELPRAAFAPDGRIGVVDADGRVALRSVEVAAWVEDRALVVGGVDAGERVPLELPPDVDGRLVAPVEQLAGAAGAAR